MNWETVYRQLDYIMALYGDHIDDIVITAMSTIIIVFDDIYSGLTRYCYIYRDDSIAYGT